MRRIAIIVTLVMSLALQAQDYARMGERSIIGSARYVGMSGAMSAIGGDASAAHDNIAGLGLYRRSEAMLSTDITHAKPLTRWTLSQASFVLSLPVINPDSKIKFHNLMIAYRRLHSYSREYYVSGGSSPSLGALIENADVEWDIPFCTDAYNTGYDLRLRESGGIHAFDFGWAANISDQWYVGAALDVQAYSMSATAAYREVFSSKIGVDGSNYYNTNETSVLYNGVGASLAAGVIYRPLRWLRIGTGIETPTVGHLITATSGTLTAHTDSVRMSYAPEGSNRDKQFHQPLHSSSSVAFQIGAYGMIALQYDLYYQPKEALQHSLRAGIEVIPILGMYINAGYAFESPFKQLNTVVPMDPTFNRQDTYFMYPNHTHYASFAIGYRGDHVMVQAAYQYSRNSRDLYAHEGMLPTTYNQDIHRVVVTLGWHN